MRNTCYCFLKRRHAAAASAEYGDDGDGSEIPDPSAWSDPERQLLHAIDAHRLEAALMTLSPEYREVLVLHEMEEMSYKQIADVAGVPIGTVMSRLSRARERLRRQLCAEPS